MDVLVQTNKFKINGLKRELLRCSLFSYISFIKQLILIFSFFVLASTAFSVTISERYHQDIQQLEEAKSVKQVNAVLIDPLYQVDNEKFVAFAHEKLKDGDLRTIQRVYLNHQLMRYYVTVEADFDEGFNYLVEVLKHGKDKDDLRYYSLAVGDAYFIAFWINQIQYDLERAKVYIDLLLEHAKSKNLDKLLIKAKMGDAELTQHMGDVSLGIKKFKTLEPVILQNEDSLQLNRLYLLLSNAYTDATDSDSAFVYAQKAYKYVPANQAQLKAFSSIHLARGYMQHDKLEEAIQLAEEALNVVEDLEAKKEIKDINSFLAEAHKTAQNYEKALMHLEKFMTLDKEQASLLSAANISNLEAKLSDEQHDFEIQLKQTELDAKNKQAIALVVFLVFALFFIFIVFRSYKIKKRDAEIISEQKTIVEEKNKEIMDSITYAKRIQSAILPPDKVVKEYLQESFILYKPKDIVAGDFYWMEHKGDKILFAAADCTGHGVPGAMVSVVCNNGLNRSVREYGLTDPGQILDKTREIVIQEFEKSEEEVKDGMDIALCSLEDNTLQYAGAHNPLWIIRNGANEIEEIKANKQPIGKTEHATSYTTHEIKLNEGDSIYVFSDGYADQFGGDKGKKLKTANFKKLLLSVKDKSMHEQKQLIDEAFENWKGELEQLDDVCVIGVRV